MSPWLDCFHWRKNRDFGTSRSSLSADVVWQWPLYSVDRIQCVFSIYALCLVFFSFHFDQSFPSDQLVPVPKFLHRISRKVISNEHNELMIFWSRRVRANVSIARIASIRCAYVSLSQRSSLVVAGDQFGDAKIASFSFTALVTLLFLFLFFTHGIVLFLVYFRLISMWAHTTLSGSVLSNYRILATIFENLLRQQKGCCVVLVCFNV